ncbi:MAG: hypothetical protein RLO17_14260 [Cyclobacteriaceae bacterium]
MSYPNLPIVLALSLMIISCNKEEVKPVEETVINLSGHENGSFDLDMEFSYSIWENSSGGPSIVFIKILKKTGTPKFQLYLKLTENENKSGFEEGQQYSYSSAPESLIIFEPIFHLEGAEGGTFQITGTATSESNWIKFSKVTDDHFEGTFEANLVKDDGSGIESKIKVTGSFFGGGETTRH